MVKTAWGKPPAIISKPVQTKAIKFAPRAGRVSAYAALQERLENLVGGQSIVLDPPKDVSVDIFRGRVNAFIHRLGLKSARSKNGHCGWLSVGKTLDGKVVVSARYGDPRKRSR